MKKILLLFICLMLLTVGCAATGSKGGNLIGKATTFKTSEPAPPEFDAWTFFWQAPQFATSDTDLQYVVLRPDGPEQYFYDYFAVSPGELVRSDFAEDLAGGDPSVFYRKDISIIFRARVGELRFSDSGSFTFYKKDRSGKISWIQPFKTVDGVFE